MLARAKSYPAFGEDRKITAADPEDIIGLKAQAMANDPDRNSQETADIQRLMGLFGANLDRNRIEEYYHVFGLGEDAERLRKRFGHA